MPTKKKPKKETKWTRRPYPSVRIDGGMNFIALDLDILVDHIKEQLEYSGIEKNEIINLVISNTMLTDKQLDELPEWDG